MAERLVEVGKNLAVYKVAVTEIREQDVNARVMPPEMFERLTANVQKDGRLEQLPFTVRRVDHFEMVSGHHRLRAARTAGLTELFILADERDLSKSQVRAKQIAHNRISGTDDLETLKRLYDDMDTIEDILESHLKPHDFDDLKQLDKVDISDLSISLPFRTFALTFLPKAIENLQELEKHVMRIPKEADEILVVPNDTFDEFRKVVLATGRTENVRSLGVTISRMLEIVREKLEADGVNVDKAAEPDEDT
jgi:hypothetical protein